MEEKYKQIHPEDLYLSFFEREATEEELWKGFPRQIRGFRPSGNDFLDLFASLVCKYGRKETAFYAKCMGVNPLDLAPAIRAISGISPRDWMNIYLLLAAKEILETTDMKIGEISDKLGFSQLSVFSKFFHDNTKQQPWEWRINTQKPDYRWRKTYHSKD